MYITRTNMDRHIRNIHKTSEEGKTLQTQKGKRRKGERKRRKVGKWGNGRGGARKNGEEGKKCEQCDKIITAHNMACHIRGFHGNSEAGKVLLAKIHNRRNSMGGRRGVRRRRNEDGDEATAGEEKDAGKSSQEEKKGVKKTTSTREKRLTQRRCQLCNYRGNDEAMTRHILNTHVINRMGKNEP